MPKYQYTIRGIPYQPTDINQLLTSLTQDLNLEAHVREMKNRFVLEIEGEADAFRTFEPLLLKTLTEAINIQSYVKKEYNTRQKRFTPKNYTDPKDAFQAGLKKCIQLLNRGDVVAIKTQRGFHILCNGAKTNAVKSLRNIIKAPTKPLPLVFKNLLGIEKFVLLSKQEKALLERENHPFVIAKKRILHRLEKERYKFVLSPHINPLNRHISVALPNATLYSLLFEEVTFPLVSIEAKTEDGTPIKDTEELIKNYGDHFKCILEETPPDEQSYPREVYQMIYGKPKRILPEEKIDIPEGYTRIILTKEESILAQKEIKPLTLLLDENRQEQPKYSALSLLFTQLPLEDILTLELPFSLQEVKTLHTQWQNRENTKESNSVLVYFDAVASLSGALHDKSYPYESLCICEGSFEVCEENLFAYTIDNDQISIDLTANLHKNNKLKHLASTLVNTLSTIIMEIAKQEQKPTALQGDIFAFRDFTELTIEKLEENGIDYLF